MRKHTISFDHPTIKAWKGEVSYKDDLKLHQALKNLSVYVPDNVKPDLKVTYCESDNEVKRWIIP